MPSEEKKKELEDLKQLVNSYSAIGLVDMLKMPTKQFQEIKRSLGDEASIKINKKSLIKLAFESSDKFKSLANSLPKQPAVIFSNLEPFTLFKKINSLKFKTYANEGDVAHEDVEVQPGPTELLAGPAISELQKVGLIAGVEGGKIAIKRSSIILKKDEVISAEVANVLRKLKIQTAVVKLKVEMLFDGDLYPKDALELVEIYPEKMKEMFNQALNLSVVIGYPTNENVKYLLAKAYQEGKIIESKIVLESKEEQKTEEKKEEVKEEKSGDKENKGE